MSKWREQKDAESTKKQKAPETPTLEEFEEGMANDVNALQQAFRDRAKQEEKRFADVCDSDYYFVVCFSNNAQLVEFCDMVHINPDEIYIDGKELARKMKRVINTPDSPPIKVQPFNKDYVSRSREGLPRE